MDRNVWLLGLRGVIAIVFGVLALLWPGLTLLALAILFGVYAIVDGVVTVGHGVRGRLETSQRVARIVLGVLTVIAGILALVLPGLTALVLVIVIGAWALVTGAIDVWMASRVPGNSPLLVLGIVSMLAGALVLLRPSAGAFAIAVVIGIWAIIAGIVRLLQAWRLYREHHAATRRAAPVG
jgi:uncharacterized membrane protein HdeD (DUF308 family)